MHRLKALFIMPYMMLMMGLAMWSAYALTAGPVTLGWIGVAIATWPFVLWISRVMILRDRARMPRHLPVLTACGAAGAALAGYAVSVHHGDVLPAVLALLGFVAFMIYNLWYSKFGRRANDILAVGARLPNFTLDSLDGERVEAASFGGRPTLWLFYRGNWCPLCMAQIKEIAGQYAELAAAGVEIVLVSPQSHAQTAALARRFKVPFRYLVDRGNATAKRLRIDAPDGVPVGMPGYASDTVLPTVVITDANGRILFSDQTDDYRVRPEPATFLQILRDAGLLVPRSTPAR